MATRSLELRWSFLLAGLAAAVLGYAAASLGGGPPAWVGAAGALALAGALWGLGGWVDRRLAEPVKAAGLIASRVAGGDLSVTVATQQSETAALGDLLSSVHSMVVALRRLVGAIRTAADEAAAMAAQISASTEQMSASTEEMAATCQDLTKRAAEQAQLVRAAADDAGRILQIVTILAAAAAAGDTADTVRGVVTRVQATRDRLLALARGGTAARDAAQSAAQGLATVATEAEANDHWSREIAKSAEEVRALVEEISARLGTVAQGTETLLAAAEQIAASSEEQTASTEEIASSANQLAEAADKLTGAVKTFRLLKDEEQRTEQAAD